jgi:hypothetical protein
MLLIEIVSAQPLDGYVVRLEFSDGVTGDVDLSHLAGRGVFKLWEQYENFKKVSIVDGRRLAWSDAIDLDADSLYLRLTGKAPEDIFPFLKEYTSYA